MAAFFVAKNAGAGAGFPEDGRGSAALAPGGLFCYWHTEETSGFRAASASRAAG